MRMIRKGLYIGDIQDAVSVFRGDSGNDEIITHVLSMVAMPDSSLEFKVDVKRKVVPLADEVEENLLCRLEECLDFISQAINGGGTLLVHCYQGLSRSVAVVVAYLMVSEGLALNEALWDVKPHCINRGFMRQLKLFQKMGRVVKREDREYKGVEAAALNERILPLRVVTPKMLRDDFKVDEEEDEYGWSLVDSD